MSGLSGDKVSPAPPASGPVTCSLSAMLPASMHFIVTAIETRTGLLRSNKGESYPNKKKKVKSGKIIDDMS